MKTGIEIVAAHGAVGGLIGFAIAFSMIFYIDFFNAHHIVTCSDKPGYVTAVTRWDWVKSWVLPFKCE
jgi:hypothetical protein